MSSDEPPPRPVRTPRRLAFVAAVFALAGVALAVVGADTTVTDATGAAPIVDDASRHDPVRYEQSQAAVDEGPSTGQEEHIEEPTARCVLFAGAPRAGSGGCSPPTLRGPPGG
jgi:hypothetical protein